MFRWQLENKFLAGSGSRWRHEFSNTTIGGSP
jgi:hypothetical protein